MYCISATTMQRCKLQKMYLQFQFQFPKMKSNLSCATSAQRTIGISGCVVGIALFSKKYMCRVSLIRKYKCKWLNMFDKCLRVYDELWGNTCSITQYFTICNCKIWKKKWNNLHVEFGIFSSNLHSDVFVCIHLLNANAE